LARRCARGACITGTTPYTAVSSKAFVLRSAASGKPYRQSRFRHVTGVFPVGTLAILDTRELAVVVARNSDPACLHQPIVKVICDWFGMMLAEPFLADLSEPDPSTGRPARTTVKTTRPEKYAIRVSDYFH
jgi:hypothetical protein